MRHIQSAQQIALRLIGRKGIDGTAQEEIPLFISIPLYIVVQRKRRKSIAKRFFFVFRPAQRKAEFAFKIYNTGFLHVSSLRGFQRGQLHSQLRILLTWCFHLP